MILKIFSPKHLPEILAVFFSQTIAIFFQTLQHGIGFHEKHHFFVETWQKSHKMLISTLAPGI
jgi:hypothetical protein